MRVRIIHNNHKLRACFEWLVTSLHRDRRGPTGAIHLHRGLGPFPYKDAAISPSLLAYLVNWFAVIQVKLGREWVILATTFPSMSEPSKRTANQQKLAKSCSSSGITSGRCASARVCGGASSEHMARSSLAQYPRRMIGCGTVEPTPFTSPPVHISCYANFPAPNVAFRSTSMLARYASVTWAQPDASWSRPVSCATVPTESGNPPPGLGQKSSQKNPDTSGLMPTLLSM